jgi:two-component system, LytTR family, response regulator LytT
MIRCITIDDEPLALRQIAAYIAKTPFLELAGQYDSALQSIELLSSTRIDLMFIDINMPDLNGINFVKTLGNPPLVVFVTAYSEYAIDGFGVNAIDYLLKPLGYREFLKSANKAKRILEVASSKKNSPDANLEQLYVKSGYKTVRVSLSDIVYIEGEREYVSIHMINGKSHMSLISLRSLEEQLPTNRFMRIHRSYIVNLTKIAVFDNSRIVLEGKAEIPVSGQYKDSFQKYIRCHSLG